jgi:hypothetical protein
MEFENKKLRDVADIAARIMMGEKALHPNQQKLDVHEPEKDELTAKDFEMLRAGKKAKEVKKESLEDFSLEEIEEFMMSEEFEQLDELSKSTLGSYVNKASDSAAKNAAGSVGMANTSLRAKNPRVKAAAEKYSNEDEATKQKRLSGIGKAVKKLTKEDVEQIDEVSLKTATSAYVKRMGPGSDEKDPYGHKAIKTMDHIANRYGVRGVARTAKAADDEYGIHDSEHNPRKDYVKMIMRGAKPFKKEEVDQAAEFVLEYESKDGKFVHRARPGVYGGTKDEKHAVDTLAGPKTKELKAIESEKKKKMSEMVATYKEQGLKGLFEALKKEEVIVEEPTSAEFDAQLADAKQRAAGTKKQPEVSKPAVQAVQNEETHTTVEVWDLDTTNGVQISEIDLEERSMTEPEMKKKEQIVKSMKKGISGFKDRYGDRAKEVMYATATKQAMKEGAEDHYQTGHDYASDHAIDSGFKATARARKKEMLADNPHKKGSSEHDEWHKGALAGHQTGLDNM